MDDDQFDEWQEAEVVQPNQSALQQNTSQPNMQHNNIADMNNKQYNEENEKVQKQDDENALTNKIQLQKVQSQVYGNQGEKHEEKSYQNGSNHPHIEQAQENVSTNHNKNQDVTSEIHEIQVNTQLKDSIQISNTNEGTGSLEYSNSINLDTNPSNLCSNQQHAQKAETHQLEELQYSLNFTLSQSANIKPEELLADVKQAEPIKEQAQQQSHGSIDSPQKIQELRENQIQANAQDNKETPHITENINSKQQIKANSNKPANQQQDQWQWQEALPTNHIPSQQEEPPNKVTDGESQVNQKIQNKDIENKMEAQNNEKHQQKHEEQAKQEGNYMQQQIQSIQQKQKEQNINNSEDDDEFGQYQTSEKPPPAPTYQIKSQSYISPEMQERAQELISRLPNYNYIRASYFLDV